MVWVIHTMYILRSQTLLIIGLMVYIWSIVNWPRLIPICPPLIRVSEKGWSHWWHMWTIYRLYIEQRFHCGSCMRAYHLSYKLSSVIEYFFLSLYSFQRNKCGPLLLNDYNLIYIIYIIYICSGSLWFFRFYLYFFSWHIFFPLIFGSWLRSQYTFRQMLIVFFFCLIFLALPL